MLDSIYVGMSGLQGYSHGLRVIANNTANMNTPGFKGASLQFGDLFYGRGPGTGSSLPAAFDQRGHGLNTLATSLDFRQGDIRQTGNELDLAIDGQGLFTVRDANGNLTYTRDGGFAFEGDTLVTRTDGARVLGRDAKGSLAEITLDGRRTSVAKATQTVTFRGNLSMTANEKTLTDVTLVDHAGNEHLLTVKFANVHSTTAGQWAISVLDGSKQIATGAIRFSDGAIDPAQSTAEFEFSAEGVTPFKVVLDFGDDVTSFASGDTSTLAVLRQDGREAGVLSKVGIDARGQLDFTYSNGDTDAGARVALARFDSPQALRALGNNRFEALDTAGEMGVALEGGFGSVRSGAIESSNVDLSSEFSDLVILQRGYQASSQIVSTASEMLQELFAMKRR